MSKNVPAEKKIVEKNQMQIYLSGFHFSYEYQKNSWIKNK